jgi:hypothetical protein
MPADIGGPDDVDAPEDAIAWMPGDGFISDPDQLERRCVTVWPSGSSRPA